jgi:hypothetical protein
VGFQNPQAFYLLILILPILVIFWKAMNKTNNVISAFKSRPPGRIYHFSKAFVIVIFFISLVVISARPYSQLQRTADLLFLIDVSRSMQARKSCSQPSYLDRAKNVIRKVITDIPEARFGINVYERLTFPITHLTFDHIYLDTVIENGLYDGLIFDRTATRLGKAIITLAQKKQNLPDIYGNLKFVILLTDGNLSEKYRDELDDAIIKLQDEELVIIPVGIGNPEPTPIPTVEDGRCVDKFIVKDGNLITVPLNSDSLRYIATNTNGQYYGEGDLNELVAYLRENALQDTFVDTGVSQRQRNDISWIFLIISTIAFFIYMLIDSDLKIKLSRSNNK